MYYVYFIKSAKDGSVYIGYTGDIKKRLEQHNKGLSQFTKPRRPYTLIYYEAYLDEAVAIKREKELKKSRYKKEEIINRLALGPIV